MSVKAEHSPPYPFAWYRWRHSDGRDQTPIIAYGNWPPPEPDDVAWLPLYTREGAMLLRDSAPSTERMTATEVVNERGHHPGCWKLQSPSGEGVCNCGYESIGPAYQGEIMKKSKSLPEWARIAKLAKHYLAIGQAEVYLNRDEEEKPWTLVTHYEPGCVVRHGQSVSGSFTATDAASGLRFRWSLDLEPREANGSSTLQIDVEKCRQILRELPPTMAGKFRKHLLELAEATRKDAEEYRAAFHKWTARAVQLETI